jgi:hypothetical protein
MAFFSFLGAHGARKSAPAFDHGRPELVFSAKQPDISGMKHAIASSGCFVLRELFNKEGIQRVRARAVHATARWENRIANGQISGHEEFVNGAYRAGHIPGHDVDVALTFSNIGTLAYDHIATALFGNASRDFGLRRSMLEERVNPLGFHQDGFFTPPGYNFWTPLNDAGLTSPGLEVVIGSGGRILSHEAIATAEPEKTINHFGLDRLWHPEVRAGDALVFTTFLMHRTYVTPTMSPLRYSLEVRGAINSFMPIAGVEPKHWNAPMINSFEEL